MNGLYKKVLEHVYDELDENIDLHLGKLYNEYLYEHLYDELDENIDVHLDELFDK